MTKTVSAAATAVAPAMQLQARRVSSRQAQIQPGQIRLRAVPRKGTASLIPMKPMAVSESLHTHASAKIDPSVAQQTAKMARRDRVVLEHLPLVKAIAIRVHENLPVHVEVDDLVHAGILGLFDAAS